MYLTRLELNPARRGSHKLLGSPHAMHAAVLHSFRPHACPVPDPLDVLGKPEPIPGQPLGSGRVLWRLDEADHRAVLYVLSPDEPDCTHLVEQAGWPTQPSWQTRSYTPLLDRLDTGQIWAFRLTANPTKSTRIKEGKRSQRVGHVTVAQQQEWFLARAEGWGFRVPSTADGGPAVLVNGRRVRSFRRNGAYVELSTAVFDGRLVVEDPQAFRRALLHGLGPAKGYGCGLMTLARPQLSPAP